MSLSGARGGVTLGEIFLKLNWKSATESCPALGGRMKVWCANVGDFGGLILLYTAASHGFVPQGWGVPGK